VAQILNLNDSSVPHRHFCKMNTYLHEANIYLDTFTDLDLT